MCHESPISVLRGPSGRARQGGEGSTGPRVSMSVVTRPEDRGPVPGEEEETDPDPGGTGDGAGGTPRDRDDPTVTK